MKKLFSKITIMAGIWFSLVAVMYVSQTVKANFQPPADNNIELTSPLTMPYKMGSVEVNFTANYTGSLSSDYSIRFWMILDNREPVLVTNRTTKHGTLTYLGNGFSDDIIEGKAVLSHLSNGMHNLTVNMAVCGPGPSFDYVLCSDSVCFAVDAPVPSISNISIENGKTYATNDIPLSFFVTEPSVLWVSLNERTNAITGNTTLRGLPDGSYSMIIYASDTDGNVGTSNPVFFTIDTTSATVSGLPAEDQISGSTEPFSSYESTASILSFSMQVEYLNYTIARRSGLLWALIDGTYPVSCSCMNSPTAVSMVYPTPPSTTNITVRLDGKVLSWSNFTEQYPQATHHTAIGDWAMIEVAFTPSDFFTLTIHYEHPIMLVNGTYQFLYDLNINPYLSPTSPNSTAYFTVKAENALSNLQVFTVPTDDTRKQVGYVTGVEDTQQVATFAVMSEYGKPLPGDVLVTFSSAQPEVQRQVQEPFPSVWIIIGVAFLVALAVGLVAHFKISQCRRQPKTALLAR